jgi:ABC-type nitrate/sulfonate/bicarbonate transport system substrate-binding protein
MIRHNGGDPSGAKIERQQGKLSLFQAVKQGRIDATWIFMPWEGVEAGIEDVKLNVFRPTDYGVPYGYSPVIAYNASSSQLSEEVLRKFVSATQEGYRITSQSPERAVEVLSPLCDPPRSDVFLRESQKLINQYYGDGVSRLGTMFEERWQAWVAWLRGQSLLEGAEIDVSELFEQI